MTINNWKLRVDNANPYLKKGLTIDAQVPGDITMDLYRAGLIPDPYYGLNHNDINWIIEQDFTYIAEFDADEKVLAEDEVLLVLDSVDLFSEIYLNGTLIGTTENMFLQYTFEVKGLLQKERNTLQVKMKSTAQIAENINCDGYMGIFNLPRIFLRKAQCHFGWDWAPNMPGYGICGEVRLEGVNSCRINDVTYRTTNSGKVTLIAELNYNIRPTIDLMGTPIKNTSRPAADDLLVYRVEKEPGSGVYIEKSVLVTGKKNFVNITVDDVQLWWPNGYGKQPLYDYQVSLFRNGEMVSCKNGKLAFRKVELVEEPKDDQLIGFEFYINGKKIFIKGSNWVPIECFTGCAREEKYINLLKLAADGNMNMLRVWGGGIYESEAFYRTCDELGNMVWQDFMMACSHIPENDEAWQANALKECEYQIKRLRNHPSIVYWSGGNEKIGSFILQPSKGDFFVDNILTAVFRRLDPTRPFGKQSPASITELGCELTSGDSHYSSLEAALSTLPLTGQTKIADYRDFVSQRVVGFLSENASFGPQSAESNRRIYPVDKLWPINEYWVDRLVSNPYDGYGGFPFAKKMEAFANDLYGKSVSVDQFVQKGMMVHAEIMRAEVEWVRAHKPVTGGVMNWMYSDIWPSGTWSVVDYYTEPKQAYYQMRRSFRPILATFTQNSDGKTLLVLDNESGAPVTLRVEYGKRTLSGQTLEVRNVSVELLHGEAYTEEVPFDVAGKNTYLYTICDDGFNRERNVYSPDFWRTAEFDSDYTVSTEAVTSNKLLVRIQAHTFVKGLFLHLPDNYKYLYSDNYLDMEPGEEKIIEITSKDTIDQKKLTCIHYAN